MEPTAYLDMQLKEPTPGLDSVWAPARKEVFRFYFVF